MTQYISKKHQSTLNKHVGLNQSSLNTENKNNKDGTKAENI